MYSVLLCNETQIVHKQSSIHKACFYACSNRDNYYNHSKVMPKHKSYVIIYEPNVHDCVHVIKFEECMFIYYHNFFCISYMTLIGMHELNAPQCN